VVIPLKIYIYHYLWYGYKRVVWHIERQKNNNTILRKCFKYLIFFFAIFNFLTIGVLANLRYNTLDYNRTAEYVQKIKPKTKKSFFIYRHFFLSRNNFQYFIFSSSGYKAYKTEQIKLKVKEQDLLKINTCPLEFLKLRTINKSRDSIKKDLYERVDSKKRVCLTCNFHHVMIIKMYNQLSFSKCINQKTKVSGFLIKSNRYLNG
jgi:hypothetical protein